MAEDISFTSDCLKARKISAYSIPTQLFPLTGQARSEKTVTEIFFDVLMAWVLLGLVKSRRAAAALTDVFIFIIFFDFVLGSWPLAGPWPRQGRIRDNPGSVFSAYF